MLAILYNPATTKTMAVHGLLRATVHHAYLMWPELGLLKVAIKELSIALDCGSYRSKHHLPFRNARSNNLTTGPVLMSNDIGATADTFDHDGIFECKQLAQHHRHVLDVHGIKDLFHQFDV